jgi:hypothetical protein
MMLERLVIVHPCIEYDAAKKCRNFIEESISNFSGKKEQIIVLSGSPKSPEFYDFPTYLIEDGRFRKVTSPDGRFPSNFDYDFLEEDVNVTLIGGNIQMCHLDAFKDIVGYVEDNRIGGVSIEIPIEGCYFESSLIKNKGVESELEGAFIVPVIFEMNGYSSYSLREVASKVFGELEKNPRFYRRQLRDEKGISVTANQDQIEDNVRGLLSSYTFFLERKKIKHDVEYRQDALVFHLNQQES